MNWKIKSKKTISFDIKLVDDIWKNSCFIDNQTRKILVIDKTVYKLYHNKIPVDTILYAIDSEEIDKNWNTVQSVLDFFQDIKVKRRETVLAVGGGVLLDLLGFCCSIYRRGIPYIRIPTTLLAMIDASVGIKTGINYQHQRNRLGSYYPPAQTLIDTSFIKTQDSRHIVNALGEIIKLAIVLDKKLFKLLEIHAEEIIRHKFQNNAANRIISRSIDTMLQELKHNLWEENLARSVDFGHSFSPVMEMKNLPNLLHGEAVILDCIFSCCIAYNRNYISKKILSRILNLLKKCNLPTIHSDYFDFDFVKKCLDEVMLHRNNKQNLPLPTEIGRHKIVNDVSDEEIKRSIEIFKQYRPL